MRLITFTHEEQLLLLPLAQKRLDRWEQEEIHDAGSRIRFRQSYLFTLRKAVAKIAAELPASYAPMEKAILAGCVREHRDVLKKTESAEMLPAFDLLSKQLLGKMDIPKRIFIIS